MSGSAADQPFDLASLDDVRPIQLLPELFTNNLAALTDVLPAMAQQIERCSIPAHWRPAMGLDGAPTFRIEQPGTPVQWLGSSAIPRTRAESLLCPRRLANVNVLLPSAGTGAELAWLMQFLPPHQAAFVAEVDPIRIAAVLRLYDYSAAIRNDQIHLLVGEDIESQAMGTLAKNPGLLAPARIINLPEVSAARIESLRAQCERAASRSAEARAARQAERAAAIPPNAVDSVLPRLGILALTTDRRVWRLADELVAAARELGWAAESFCLNSPRRVHPAAQAEWLATFHPTWLILCDTPAEKIALKQVARIFGLAFTPDRCRDDPGLEIHLAFSPRHEAALRSAGVSPSRIVAFPWGASAEKGSADAAPTIDLLFLSDSVSLDPSHHGIEHTTHGLLWSALQTVIRTKWAEKESGNSEALLREAQRALGFDLPDKAQHMRFAMLVERVLVPATVLAELIALAKLAGLRFAAVGDGWGKEQRMPARERPMQAFPTVAAAAAAGVIPRLAISTLLPDGIRQEGIDALAHGIPLALHVPPGVRPGDYLSARLLNSQCIESHSAAADWRSLFQGLNRRGEGLRRRAEQFARIRGSYCDWKASLSHILSIPPG